MNYTQEQLNEAFNKLPETVQDFILSDEAVESIGIIADEYLGTDPQKLDAFALDVFALAVGIGTPEEFLNSIKAKFILLPETANQILIEVNDLFLEPTSYLLDKEIEQAETGKETPKSETPKNAETPRYIGPEFELEAPKASSDAKPKTFPFTVTRPMRAEVTVGRPATSQTQTGPVYQPKIQETLQKPHVIPPIKTVETPPAAKTVQAPANIPTHGPSILDSKLGGMTRLPTEEIDVSQKPKEQKAQQKPSTEKDPYREPIE